MRSEDPSHRSARVEDFVVPASESGRRLDVAVTMHLPQVSRAQVQRWIAQGRVRIEGRRARASHLCRQGERVEVTIPHPVPATPAAESLHLDVVFEDAHLIVVAKPAGMVVHPSPGHRSGTLVNALLAHSSDLSGIGGVERPGIVHRLDSGTSGLLVVAKNDRAHRHLTEQFQRREVEKRYLAIVHGAPADELVVEAAIGRDRKHRKKISTRSARPKSAKTEIQTLERFPASALVSVRIHTGRTHQIRVHLSEKGYPVVGDREYGRKASARPRGPAAPAFAILTAFERPALHAAVLGLRHPVTGEPLRWEAPLPEDMRNLLEQLRSLGEGSGIA